MIPGGSPRAPYTRKPMNASTRLSEYCLAELLLPAAAVGTLSSVVTLQSSLLNPTNDATTTTSRIHSKIITSIFLHHQISFNLWPSIIFIITLPAIIIITKKKIFPHNNNIVGNTTTTTISNWRRSTNK